MPEGSDIRLSSSQRVGRRAALGGLAGLAATAALPGGVRAAQLADVTLTFAQASRTGTKAVLEASGMLKDLPYRVEWAQFNSTPQVLEALESNTVDVGFGGDTGLIFALARGKHPGFVGVAASTAGGPLRDGSIEVLKDSPIRSVADLRGKRVAVTAGTGTQYFVLQWLASAGLNYSDIVPVSLAPPEALAALRTGKIDAWGAYETHRSIAQVKFGTRSLTDSLPVTGGYTLLYAHSASLADPLRATAIADIVRRGFAGERWVADHRDAWAQRVGSVTGLEEAVAQVSAARIRRIPVPLDATVFAALRKEADAFFDLGLLPSRVDATPAFDTRFNTLLQS
jgi:sulfonate transport system substrate-binding protein